MARARLIHPEFSRHEGLAELKPIHRLLFALLPTIADREGLLEDRPRRIQADLFPYDSDEVADVGKGLEELSRIGCIVRVSLHGRDVITIPGFLRWNRPHLREKASELSKPAVITRTEGVPKANPRHSSSPPRLPVVDPVSVSDPVTDPVSVSVTGSKATTLPSPKIAKAEGRSTPAWKAYAAAYLERHGAAPPRNKDANRLLCNLIDKIGLDAAPAVAAFYVTHNWSKYVNGKHPLEMLAYDAAKLHTEWKTGQKSTMVGAQLQERTAENFGSWSRHLSTGAK